MIDQPTGDEEQSAETKQSRIWFEEWWKKNRIELSDLILAGFKEVAWKAWTDGRDDL